MNTSPIPVDILAIGVHPDDVELSCSGTLLRHINLGYRVGLLDLTRGELGSRGSAEIRTAEALTSAQQMGASFRHNLDLPDGFIQWNEATLRAIIQVIRACQPSIVLANATSDRHPDHGRAAKITSDACYYSGLLKIETADDSGKPQEKWRPKALYHYVQDRNISPNLTVDISDFLEQKMELIQCFRSQFNQEENNEYAEEPSTPISGKSFMEYQRAKAKVYGRDAGYDYAEAFIFERLPGVPDLLKLD
ncbi:MAG: bacillithiol biosynthesis deacetylase BshB1 [Bacteroidota bacterium]